MSCVREIFEKRAERRGLKPLLSFKWFLQTLIIRRSILLPGHSSNQTLSIRNLTVMGDIVQFSGCFKLNNGMPPTWLPTSLTVVYTALANSVRHAIQARAI